MRWVVRTAREILAYWSQERRTVRQGFIALAIATGVGMLAGVVLGSMDGLLERLPGLLVLVPAAIGMRGAIFGALGARLGTGMLTGQYDGRVRRGNFAAQNVTASIMLSFASSALAALFARGAAAAIGLPSISLWDLLTVSMIGGMLASGFILSGVLGLGATAQRRNWDMDAIGSPLITATGDMVTLPALVVATMLLDFEPAASLLGGALLVGAVIAGIRGARTQAPIVRRIMRESLPVLAYSPIMDILAGSVLEARIHSFVTSPALFVLIPPFIAACGSLGGILAARLGSQFHLGLLESRRVPQRPARLEASITALFSLSAFTGVGLVAHFASRLAGFASPGLGEMIAISLTGGLMAFVPLFLTSYWTAAASFRFGLDPDNHGIPIVTATMDLLGVLCLVAAMALYGVS